MPELDFQKVLVRIWTDEGARESFLAGSDVLLEQYSLDAHDLERLHLLRAANPHGLSFFTGLLGKKRMTAAKRLTPLMLRVVGESKWDELWREHCRAYGMEGVSTVVADACRFVSFVIERTKGDLPSPSWQMDVLQYERHKLAVCCVPPTKRPDYCIDPLSAAANEVAPLAHPGLVVHSFLHDPARWLRELRSRGHWPGIAQEPCEICFYRSWETGGVRAAGVTHRIGQFLLDCDGRNTLAELLSRFAECRGDETDRVAVAAEQAFLLLKRRGVLVFMRVKPTE